MRDVGQRLVEQLVAAVARQVAERLVGVEIRAVRRAARSPRGRARTPRGTAPRWRAGPPARPCARSSRAGRPTQIVPMRDPPTSTTSAAVQNSVPSLRTLCTSPAQAPSVLERPDDLVRPLLRRLVDRGVDHGDGASGRAPRVRTRTACRSSRWCRRSRRRLPVPTAAPRPCSRRPVLELGPSGGGGGGAGGSAFTRRARDRGTSIDRVFRRTLHESIIRFGTTPITVVPRPVPTRPRACPPTAASRSRRFVRPAARGSGRRSRRRRRGPRTAGRLSRQRDAGAVAWRA